jgi:TonB family protein
MNKSFFTLLFISITLSVFAQKDFEGMIIYRNEVASKIGGMNSASWKKITALPDSDTALVKKGNFRQSSSRKDVYYISEKQKVFFRFKGIDTLYYMDYSDDTSTVLAVTKTTDKKRIAGYDCNSLVIQTSALTSKYYYSPSLYMNPVYNENNKIDQYNVFAKETSSLFLDVEQDAKAFTLKTTCLEVQAEPVDDAVFKLPDLPQKKFSLASFITLPEYAGKEGWLNYLQKNIDANIAAKYLKIPRKENSASQSVMVSFTVSETGGISNITVLNSKEVAPQLADEAIRVVYRSRWNPATAFGEKIAYKMTQPITFQVTKQ